MAFIKTEKGLEWICCYRLRTAFVLFVPFLLLRNIVINLKYSESLHNSKLFESTNRVRTKHPFWFYLPKENCIVRQQQIALLSLTYLHQTHLSLMKPKHSTKFTKFDQVFPSSTKFTQGSENYVIGGRCQPTTTSAVAVIGADHRVNITLGRIRVIPVLRGNIMVRQDFSNNTDPKVLGLRIFWASVDERMKCYYH